VEVHGEEAQGAVDLEVLAEEAQVEEVHLVVGKNDIISLYGK
jgi:hypothetical protein